MQARALLTHESSGFSDRGFAGTLTYDPRPNSDRGLSLVLRQSVGASAAGGVDALFGQRALAGLGAEDGDELSRQRLEMRVAANGFASDVAFFGGIGLFSLVGCWHQDRRKLAAGDRTFERFHAATAFVPFTRRGAMRGLRELPPLAVIIGIVVALVARCLHPSTGGCGSLN